MCYYVQEDRGLKTERNVRKLKKLLKQAGWEESPSEGKGSHTKYRKGSKTVTVPTGYGGELQTGMARKIMKDAGLDTNSTSCAYRRDTT